MVLIMLCDGVRQVEANKASIFSTQYLELTDKVRRR
jgi:hypothetical protein